MLDQRPAVRPSDDNDWLAPETALDELGGLVFDFTQTTAERLEHLVRRGAIKPGLRGDDGKIRYRRGDLNDSAFEHCFGRKRPGRRAAS